MAWSIASIAALDLTIACGLSLWPIWNVAGLLQHWHGWTQLYTFTGSNLDIWVATFLKVAVGTALLSSVNRPQPTGAPSEPNLEQIQAGLSWVSNVFQCLLVAKALAGAVGAPERVLPMPGLDSGEAGLLCLFGSIVSAFVCTWLEQWLATRLAEQRSKRPLSPAAILQNELATPLLAEEGRGGTDGEKPGKTGKDKGKGKEEPAKKAINRKTVATLVKLSAPDAWLLAGGFVTGAAAALGTALVPYYTGRILDHASIEPDRHKFLITCGKLVAVAAFCSVFTGLRGGIFTICMTRLNVRIRTLLFQSLLRQEVGFFDTTRTGEITSRLSADTTAVSDQVALNLNVFLRSMMQAIVVLLFMFLASWRLTVVTFTLIPVVMVICKVYGNIYRKLSEKVQTELAEANTVAEETLSTMITVKAHAAESSSDHAYVAQLSKYYLLLQKEAIAYAMYACVNTFAPYVVMAAALYYGGNLVFAGQMSAGHLVSFILYQSSLSNAFSNIGDVFSGLTAAVGAADKVLELMHRKPQIEDKGTIIPAAFEGRVQLDAVVFSYPSRPDTRVLNCLSMSVQPGEVVALVGPSGGGKSSIVKLLERFYLPQSGAVLLDGRNIAEYNAKWLRRQVALVSQEPVLYARTIRRNIMFGLEPEDDMVPPTQDEIEEAARLANAEGFIASFCDGYETQCGEKGAQLSGGQKQRIAIARALVRRPSVLLLDEATSALDADSEAVVQEALDRLMHQRTTIVIAHRLSTIQDADRIVVIAGGSVQEMGTHEELLMAGGTYAALVRRQLSRPAGSSQNLSRIASGQSLES